MHTIRTRQHNPIRFITWNVKGLQTQTKTVKVFSHLKNMSADIVFLQETHLVKLEHNKLRRSWVNQVFHSNYNTKARGVAILINKRIQFIPSEIILDREGRYVIVAGRLFQEQVLLVNVYAPNWDDENFVKRLLSILPNLDSHKLILGGDLNCVMNPGLDRSSSKTASLSKMARHLSFFMEDNSCVDPWRTLHPSNKSFSFFSSVHKSYSRIDYFFINSELLDSVTHVDYLAIVISDHAPLQMDVKFGLYHKDPSYKGIFLFQNFRLH